MSRQLKLPNFILPLATVAVLAWGGLAALTSGRAAAQRIWFAGLVVVGGPLLLRTLRDAAHGRFATDIVASLSIGTAIALHEPIAGLVIVLMQSGGEAIERYAEGRASAAVAELEAAAPRMAHRIIGHRVEDVAASAVATVSVHTEMTMTRRSPSRSASRPLNGAVSATATVGAVIVRPTSNVEAPNRRARSGSSGCVM